MDIELHKIWKTYILLKLWQWILYCWLQSRRANSLSFMPSTFPLDIPLQCANQLSWPNQRHLLRALLALNLNTWLWVILAPWHLGKDDNKLTLEQSQVTKSELQTFWIEFRVPGSGRFPGEWNGYLLQYSGLENSMVSQWVGHNWATFTFISTQGSV